MFYSNKSKGSRILAFCCRSFLSNFVSLQMFIDLSFQICQLLLLKLANFQNLQDVRSGINKFTLLMKSIGPYVLVSKDVM